VRTEDVRDFNKDGSRNARTGTNGGPC